MTDAHLLAQALLLLPDPADQTSEKSGLTHLIPFVFFSGVILHTLLSGEEPQSSSVWRWSEAEREMYEKCLGAVTEGLEDVIIGWSRTQVRSMAAPAIVQDTADEHDLSGEMEKAKRKKKRSPKSGKGLGTGRFEALNGLTI